MRTEYKRDMNHNYLIVYGENEINTDSYQVRMLAGNVIPSLLKCRIQGMDGRFFIYFDITSKQAVNVLYEEKKMGVEDLRLIFGGFVKAMEDAAEYLINPGQFIMSPEYIYTDIEKRQIYFCMMPGYEKDIKEQFQLLTEYILPKIDHQDQDAALPLCPVGILQYRKHSLVLAHNVVLFQVFFQSPVPASVSASIPM